MGVEIPRYSVLPNSSSELVIEALLKSAAGSGLMFSSIKPEKLLLLVRLSCARAICFNSVCFLKDGSCLGETDPKGDT